MRSIAIVTFHCMFAYGQPIIHYPHGLENHKIDSDRQTFNLHTSQDSLIQYSTAVHLNSWNFYHELIISSSYRVKYESHMVDIVEVNKVEWSNFLGHPDMSIYSINLSSFIFSFHPSWITTVSLHWRTRRKYTWRRRCMHFSVSAQACC